MNRSPMSELGVSERALAFAASLADMEEHPAPQQINFNPNALTPASMNEPRFAPESPTPPPRSALAPPPRQDPLAEFPSAPPQAMPYPMMTHAQAQQVQATMDQAAMMRAGPTQEAVMRSAPPPPQPAPVLRPAPQQEVVMRAAPQHEFSDYPPPPTQMESSGPNGFPPVTQSWPAYPPGSPGQQSFSMSSTAQPSPGQAAPDSAGMAIQPAPRAVLLPGLRPSQQASPQVAQPFSPVQQNPMAGSGRAVPAPESVQLQEKCNALEQSLKAIESERAALVQEQDKLRTEVERLIADNKVKNTAKDHEQDESRQYTARLEAEKEDLSVCLRNALGEVEQLAREKQMIEERLATSLTTLEQLVAEKEDMVRENEELKESERKAVRGEILNQRFERKEAAAKFQELEEELSRTKEENSRLKEHNEELSERAGAIAKILDEKAQDMSDKEELQVHKDEALAKLNEQIAINSDLEQQMVEYQKRAMALQAAKVDDERLAKIEKEELMDQKDNLERKVLELSELSQEKVALASSLLEEKLQTQQELHELKTELETRLDDMERLKRDRTAEREVSAAEIRRLNDQVAELGEEKALKAMELADAIKARQSMQAVLEDEKIKVQRELEQAQYDREQARREREVEEKNRAYLTEALDTLTPKLQLQEKELKLAKNETETANRSAVSLKGQLEKERLDAEQDRQELLRMLNKASTELTALKAEKRQMETEMLALRSETLSKQVMQSQSSLRGNGMTAGPTSSASMGDASRQTALA